MDLDTPLKNIINVIFSVIIISCFSSLVSHARGQSPWGGFSSRLGFGDLGSLESKRERRLGVISATVTKKSMLRGGDR